MSNYFYHPLGGYAENYLNNSANYSQLPHTREDHGWSKMDFGVGGNLPVYSMSNGIIINCGWFEGNNDNVSKYGVVVKTTDCGYSRMMAKLKGGTSEDFPLYFTYIEMDSLSEGIEKGNTITKGTQIGITNSEYLGSNLHFDIQPYDRYSMDNSGGAEQWAGCISLTRYDAYGDKGSEYSLEKHLDSNFTTDFNKNLKDSSGKYMGINSNNIFYPPSSSGTPVLINTHKPSGVNQNVLNALGPNDMAIKNWYSFAILTQTPIKIENNNNDTPILTEGWYPSNDANSTGIEGYFSNGLYTFPVYNQYRGPWVNELFWDGTFSSDACNICACATILSGLLKKTILPTDVKKKAYDYYGYGEYISHEEGQKIINNLPLMMELFGAKVANSAGTKEQAKEHLISGKPVEVNVKGYYGAGSTSSGHLISFLGYNKNTNQVFIGDPAGRKGSGWYNWSDANATAAWYILAG